MRRKQNELVGAMYVVFGLGNEVIRLLWYGCRDEKVQATMVQVCENDDAE